MGEVFGRNGARKESAGRVGHLAIVDRDGHCQTGASLLISFFTKLTGLAFVLNRGERIKPVLHQCATDIRDGSNGIGRIAEELSNPFPATEGVIKQAGIVDCVGDLDIRQSISFSCLNGSLEVRLGRILDRIHSHADRKNTSGVVIQVGAGFRPGVQQCLGLIANFDLSRRREDRASAESNFGSVRDNIDSNRSGN